MYIMLNHSYVGNVHELSKRGPILWGASRLMDES